MSPEIAERVFGDAIECGLLRTARWLSPAPAQGVRPHALSLAARRRAFRARDAAEGADRAELPREAQRNIDMESYRIQQIGSGSRDVCVVSCQRSPEPVFLGWKSK